MAAQMTGYLVGAGISSVVIYAVLRMVTQRWGSPGHGGGPALRTVAAMERSYQAAYFYNAAIRVQRSMRGGKTLRQALDTEHRWYLAHLHAAENRKRAARQIDQAARAHLSTMLGWKAVIDARTTPECREANGKNFALGAMPVIGYPGMVHSRCRCKAVAPYPDAAVLPSY